MFLLSENYCVCVFEDGSCELSSAATKDYCNGTLKLEFTTNFQNMKRHAQIFRSTLDHYSREFTVLKNDGVLGVWLAVCYEY